MDYLFQDGGKPKKTKSKTTKSKTTKSKTSTKTGTKTTKSKTSTKTGSKTTKSKTSTKKGGNFLGSVGDLVAPTGWGPFATAAALVGLDRVDAALRRGKSTKSSAKKGGMRGGKATAEELGKFKPAIKVIYAHNPGLPHQFFDVYENYFSRKNEDKFMGSSKSGFIKLQQQRYEFIRQILELVKIYSSYQNNQYYNREIKGVYLGLALKILNDIKEDYITYYNESLPDIKEINRKLM